MALQLTKQEIDSLVTKCKQDPVYFAETVLGVKLWQKQKDIIRSVCEHSNTAVASGHGIGKTFITAVCVLWFLFCYEGSKVITTAPTWRQVKNVLWSEISSLYARAKYPLGGKLTQVGLDLAEDWFAIGLSTDKPDRFQGFHAEFILVVFDEAPGVEPLIWEAAEGLLTTQHAKFLAIGNPVSPSGPFAEKFKPDIERWQKMHISCYDSPNITEKKIVYPKLVTQKWIDERKEEWGEQSPMFISRVLGEFPDEGEDTLIPLSWCMNCVNVVKENPGKHMWLGVDVGRFGTSKTTIIEYRPNKVSMRDAFVGKDLMEACGRVIRVAVNMGTDLMGILVDDTGLGGGLVDRLRELSYPVQGISFARRPADPNHFKGLRDEMWWMLREIIRSEEIKLPDDGELLGQLSSVRYKFDSRQRIVVETKDEMRKRGMKSPDKADGLMLAVYGARNFTGSRKARSKVYEEDFAGAYY